MDTVQKRIEIDALGEDKTGAIDNSVARSDSFNQKHLRNSKLSNQDLDGSDLVGADLTGINLAGMNLAGMDLTGIDLAGKDLTGADLSNARLFQANMKGVHLNNAILDGAELAGADLSQAEMGNVSAKNTGFGMANLENAKLFNANFENATLSLACLNGTDFKAAVLNGARLREAQLQRADFTHAQLKDADMSLCNVSEASFKNADLRRARLRALTGFENANWIGVDIRDVNFSGAYLMRRFIIDQNFLYEFKHRSRLTSLLYNIWWITSDCGRSIARWCFWTFLLVLLFGLLYTVTDVNFGQYKTWLSPFYYSVVTLTSLGYGDVVPASASAQMIAMLEVLLGYVMLGGLLSIFANKMSRRAD